MSVKNDLNELAARFGIVAEYRGFGGELITTNPDTQKALLRANGLVLDNVAMISEEIAELKARDKDRILPDELIVESHCASEIQFGLDNDWQIKLDDGGDNVLEGFGGPKITLPPLPPGIHEISTNIGGLDQTARLISAPIRSPSITELGAEPRIWGLNSALYGLRSSRNRGLGDYNDLAQLSQIAATAGAEFLGINPVHSIGYADMQTISPYSPSHRGFNNIEHIATDHIRGLGASPRARSILLAAYDQIELLRTSRLVHHLKHRCHHHQALEALYVAFCDDGEPAVRAQFDDFRRKRGERLEQYCLFEAISEENGGDWRQWPEPLKNREPQALSAARQRYQVRISFHCWLQWVADDQIAAAQSSAVDSGMSLGLYLDLAVGARRGGAESWCEFSTIAEGVSLGAPPDQLNSNGQNWDISAYAPQKLVANKYDALRRTFREAMRHCRILRIDHALGLNRSFWIPDDGSPGGYIKQPFDTLLAIIAIEAEAAECAVIGEDLGLVPDDFRQKMHQRGIYSYCVLQYEKNDSGQFTRPADLRAHSLACFGTHDTPTLKGYWKGVDIDLWQQIGLLDADGAAEVRHQRQVDLEGLISIRRKKELKYVQSNLRSKKEQAQSKARNISYKKLYHTVHAALAGSSAAMVSVQLDDVLGQTGGQNYPGTIDEYPNWRQRYTKTIEELGESNILGDIGHSMRENNRGLAKMVDKKVERNEL